MSVTTSDTALQKQKDDIQFHVNPGCTFQCLKAESDTIYTPPTLQQDDGVPSGWKPLSLSAPILSAVAILSLLIAAAVEVLAQKSAQDGGLALSATQDDIPRYAMIFYLYGPNVVAVLYSLIWSWIDIDTKRMQPWFELSKPNGATAANSLFLDYPYDFVAFVPWKAAKRKHWPVMLSGLTMVLVFWVVTPLQSAVLGLGSVSVTQNVNITARGRLVDVDKQQDLLDPRVLSTGYAIGWLGQPYPSFMTGEYALLPFHVDDKDKGVQHNLTATTTKMWTDLECWPAKVSPNGPPAKAQFDFLNGQGCNTTINFNLYSNYTMLYVGYYSSAYSDFALGSPSCPETEQSKHQFLAIWAETQGANTKTTTVTFNITAMYCQPSYSKQDVTVVVSGQTRTPVPSSFSNISSTAVLKDTEFNSTAFEYLLANGIGDDPVQHDFPFNSVIEQHPRLADKNLTRPVSNMVGFALAGQNLPVSAYSDPKILQRSFERAHRSLFSLATQRLSVNYTDFSNHTATSASRQSGILVSRPFSAAIEAMLFSIGLVTVTLLWTCRKSPSNLLSNPSSITRLAETFRANPELLERFTISGKQNYSELIQELNKSRYKLSWMYHDGCVVPTVVSIARPAQGLTQSTVGKAEPTQPMLLKRGAGVAFMALLSTMVSVLVVLFWQVSVHNGLGRPTENFEVLQFLENYLPTILATFIEPLWVVLNRYLCSLQPFRTTMSGQALQSKSVDTTYTAIPPQLTVRRALKNSHFLLAGVCIIALLSNVLSVGLGALFNEAQTIVPRASTFSSPVAAQLNSSAIENFDAYLDARLVTSSRYQDHFYITMANITLGTPLPPWTTSDFYFRPLTFDLSQADSSTTSYQVLTEGYGIQVACNPFPAQTVPVNTLPEVDNISDSTPCPNPIDVAMTRMRKSTMMRAEGPSAFEYSYTLSKTVMNARCDNALTVAWGRTPEAQNMNSTITASFAVCSPSFITGKFLVNVDGKGYVQSYTRQQNTDTSSSHFGTNTDISSLIAYANHFLQADLMQWHNTTHSYSWMGYLVAEMASRSILDPHAPVPDPTHLTSTIEKIMRQLFATLLSQNNQLFNTSENGIPVKGHVLKSETRIFMDYPAFGISLSVLLLNIVTVAIFYLRVQVRALPQMPSTIGSTLAYIAPSRAIKVYGLGLSSKTLSFGQYKAKDNSLQIGVELDSYVTPVEER